jgi:hypothetical protein
LGQAADYSALAIVEEPVWSLPERRFVSASTLSQDVIDAYAWQRWQAQRPTKPPLWLRTLHRFPKGTPYPVIVDDVIRRLGGGAKGRDDALLAIDGTGVGAAVVDMFRFSNLPCEFASVIITGGTKAEGNHIPKRDLIGAVQVVLQTDRLQVAKESEHTATWQKEMQGYAIKLTSTGHDTYNARADSIHDDLVLAVALAVYYRGRLNLGE